jgi:RHS repeat-associated protein
LYDLAGNVVTELSATGGWNRVEIYASGKHVATYSGGATGTTYFDHVDWLGTERARTDAQGDMAETCTGLPYGDDLNCTAGGLSPLYFTGKERDTETGNDYFGARYYGSGAGRFMSSDPSGGHLMNPQSLNRYAYVRSNPLSLTDPTGLSPNLPPPVEGWGDWFQQLGGMCSVDFGETSCGLLGESESTASAGYVYRDPITGNTYTYAEYGGNLEADQTLREITHVCSGNSACTLQSDVLWLVGPAGSWRFLMSYALGDRFVGTPEDQQIHALANAVVAKAGYLTSPLFWGQVAAVSTFGALSLGAGEAWMALDAGPFPALAGFEGGVAGKAGYYFPGGPLALSEFISGLATPSVPTTLASAGYLLGELLGWLDSSH